MDYVEEIVELIYLGEQPERFEDLGIDVFLEPNGARFIDAHRPQVGGSVVEAEHVVLSTGSSPRRVTVLGDRPLRFLDNENSWESRSCTGFREGRPDVASSTCQLTSFGCLRREAVNSHPRFGLDFVVGDLPTECGVALTSANQLYRDRPGQTVG